MAITDGLVLRLEAPTGIVDQSPVNRTGMAYQGGMGTALDSGRLCYVFDGTDDTITTGIDCGVLPIISHACWIKLDASIAISYLFGHQDVDRYYLRNDSNTLRIGLGAQNVLSNVIASLRGNWRHVYAYANATSHKLYVDGVDVFSGAAAFGSDRPTIDYTIGGSEGEDRKFKGRMDSVWIYDRELSLPEIQLLASARGAGTNYFLNRNAVVNPIFHNPIQPVIF